MPPGCRDERRGASPTTLDVPSFACSSAFYDRLVERLAYEYWKENFKRLERRYGLHPRVVEDVACGTERATRYLVERGCEEYAVDISPHMPHMAAEAVEGERAKACLLGQDMRYLDLPRRGDTLICASDSLNHLLREDDVRLALRTFLRVLENGGRPLRYPHRVPAERRCGRRVLGVRDGRRDRTVDEFPGRG